MDLELAAINFRVEPAREEEIEAAETCIDAFLIGLHAGYFFFVDTFMLCHKLVIAACVFIATAVERKAFLLLR